MNSVSLNAIYNPPWTVSRLNSDVAVIQDGISTNVSMFLRSVCVIGASIVALFVMSPILALTMCTGMIPVASFSLYTGHKMRELAKEVSAEKAKMSTIADESLGNIRTVKAFANEEEELRKFSLGSDEVYKLGV